MDMKMLAATPAFPVRDVPSAVAFYRDRLGFEARHVEDGFGIIQRDEIAFHLWEANSPDTPARSLTWRAARRAGSRSRDCTASTRSTGDGKSSIPTAR